MVLKFRYLIHKRLVFMKEASLHSVVVTSSQDREHTYTRSSSNWKQDSWFQGI